MGQNRRLIDALLLAAAVLLFHGRVLFDATQTYPWDFRGYHLPLATAYADALREGVFPFWDPYTFCGRPIAANPQAAVFYPGMFAAVLPGREGLLARLEWLAAAHVYLSALFTYLLAGRLGCMRVGALLAAVAFSLGAFFVSQAQHLGMILGAPWMVFAWWGALSESKLRPVWVATGWALCLLCGFTAMLLVTVATTLLWLGARRAWLDSAKAAALAIGLSAVQLALTMELLGQSIAKYRTDWIGLGGGIPMGAIWSMLNPGFTLAQAEPTQSYLFAGLSTLVCAALGMFRTTRLLGAITGLCFVLMFGEFTPVGSVLFRVLPQFVQRSLYWYVFLAPAMLGLALLAGKGSERLGRGSWLAVLLVFAEVFWASGTRPLWRESTIAFPHATEQVLEGSPELTALVRQHLGDFRVDTGVENLTPMTAAPILRWRSANGYDPMALEGVLQARHAFARNPQRWGAYYPVHDPESPTLDAMSVRVLISREKLNSARWQLVGEAASRNVYVNPRAESRYRAEGCEVRVVAERRNEVLLRTICREASRLDTSEASYSAWIATVGGAATPVRLVNRGFRALDLPAGEHEVRFAYSTKLTLWVGAVTMLVWSFALRCLWQGWRDTV